MKKIKRIACIIMAAFIIISAPLASYMEAQATAADLVIEGGSIAFKEILLKLMISTGLVYAGYEFMDITTNESIAHKSIEEAFKSDPTIGAALADAAKWESAMQEEKLPSDYSYTSSSGFRVINGGKNNNNNKKGISVSLTAGLITASRDAIKKWADSNENIFEGDKDASLAGKQEVNSEYMSSITTTVKSLPSLASMKDIDAYFGIDGAYDYLSLAGYSDSKYYFMINVSGSKIYFMPIPVGYSVVGCKTVYLGKEGVVILSNSNAKSAINQNGIRDSSSFYSYFWGLPTYTGNYFTYDASSDSWTKTENVNYLPGSVYLSGLYSMNNWYTCNYQAAYANGASISFNYYKGAMERVLYTFKTVSKYLTYDSSTAFPIPSEGIDFDIPEDDFAGFDYPDLSALVSYISSLSDELSRWREEQDKNQETIIQQGKDTLEAINNMHSTIGKISTFVGRISTSVLSVERTIKALPEQIAETLGDALVLPGLEELSQGIAAAPELIVDGLVSAFPPVITDALVEVFPNADEVADRIISLPQDMAKVMEGITFTFPEITFPEVPDVNVTINPDITLDPSYNITVENDYTGLEGTISNAVEGVLTDAFVPDQDLALQRIDDMKEYFEFADELKIKIGFFAEDVAGIKPSPYLKIPLGKIKDTEYNYGLGDYWIIDCTWYIPYKDYGDKIILCLFWAVILWQFFIKLPGIISGSAASVDGVYTSWYRYLDTKGPARIEGKKG